MEGRWRDRVGLSYVCISRDAQLVVCLSSFTLLSFVTCISGRKIEQRNPRMSHLLYTHPHLARISLRQRGGRSSYFDNINSAPEEAGDESWNKYSAPVTSGMKVGPRSVFHHQRNKKLRHVRFGRAFVLG